MRTKFKIKYPEGHEKAGEYYKPSNKKSMVVMSAPGIFFLFTGETYYPCIQPLCDVLPRYDVEWIN